jgi:uncharacterized membrane protein HdeD (DUF308 family)
MSNGLVWTQQARIVTGICWLVVGIIGLAANFIPFEWMAQSWKLWPLIPLLIGAAALLGVDLDFGYRALPKRD